jgi:hypothetical protein
MTNLNDVMLAYESNAAELNECHDGKWLLICDGQFKAFEELVYCAGYAERHCGGKPYLIRMIGSDDDKLPVTVFYHAAEVSELAAAHVRAA